MLDAAVESKTPGFSLTSFNTLLVAAVGLASAELLYFGTGLHPIWWLLWLAPVPVLAIAPRLRGRAAFLLGAIAWFLGEMNQLNYLKRVVALPLRIVILLFRYCRRCFWSWGFVYAKLPAPRLTLPRGVRFPCLLGHLRVSHSDRIASQHIRQSRLHPNGFSAADPDRFGHRHLGNQLRCVSVCRYSCGTLKRRRQTQAAPRIGDRCGDRGFRGACIRRMAVAVESFSQICRRNAHRQGRADERLSRL